MIKLLAALSAASVALSLFAYTPESITHKVKKDNLVKKGTIRITSKEVKEETFTLELKYSILAKVLFFERVLEGTKSVELSTRYLSPYGYEELEEAGRLEDEKITVIHMGRKNLPNHYDCHVVKIIPKKDRKWDGIFTYCQDIPSIGFARTQIQMREIPWVGEHTVYTYIVE